MSFEWLDTSDFIRPLREGEIENLDSQNGLMFIAMFTDKLAGGYINNGKLDIPDYVSVYNKLLEMRIFCTDYEILWRRSGIGEDFVCRKTIDTQSLSSDCFFDEEQLLDINSSVNNDDFVFTAIGGGRYRLPLQPNENAVKIRNYINYSDETGRAFVVDFRVLGFTASEVKKNA